MCSNNVGTSNSSSCGAVYMAVPQETEEGSSDSTSRAVKLLRALSLSKLKYRAVRQRYQLLLLLILLGSAAFLLVYLLPDFKTCPDVPAWIAATRSDSERIVVSPDFDDWTVADDSGNIVIQDNILGCANDSSCYAYQSIPVSFEEEKYIFSSVQLYRKGERTRDGLDGVYYDRYADLVRVGIRCLDATQTKELCHVVTTTADSFAWSTYWMSGLAPVGTRYLRVEAEILMLAGDANDGQIKLGDDFEIHVKEFMSVPEPEIVKKPALFGVLQNTMCVMWETDSNLAHSVVRWKRGTEQDSYANDYSGFTFEASPMTQQLDFCHYLHSACMRGLEVHTTYNYYVSTGLTKSEVYFFTTAVAPGSTEHFDMAVIADNQNGVSRFRKNVMHLGPRDIDFVVHVGDMVQGNDLWQWHFQYFAPLALEDLAQKRPFLFVRGNHDEESALTYAYTPSPHFTAVESKGARDEVGANSFLGSQSEFLSHGPVANTFVRNTIDDPLALHPPFFTAIYGNAHILVLDTNADVATSPRQFEFLKQKLALTNNCAKGGFLIVFLHACPFTNLWDAKSSYNGDEWIRTNFVDLFEEHCVDLVVSGHTHAYQRGKMTADGKVTYVVAGGGGGALDKLVWKVYSLTDDVIDEFSIDKC